MPSDPAHLGAAFALAAALCWSISPLIAAGANSHLGGIGFSRIRSLCAALLLGAMSLWTGGWSLMQGWQIRDLLLSGVVGVFVGDTLLFMSMAILGPRRSGLLFSTHAAMTAAVAALVLGERLTPPIWAGIALVSGGVMLATFYGKSRDNSHLWEADVGAVGLGAALGLGSALAQALGAILAKPAMAAGADPVAGSALRMAASAILHLGALLIWPRFAALRHPLTPGVFWRTFLVALIAMGLGMTFFLEALAHGQAGWVAVLSTLSTILILPLLWIVFKRPPPAGAWAGAGAATLGTALILLNLGA